MSDSSSEIAELIAQVTQIQFVRCVIISGIALVFYEYALTFPAEVSEIWNPKFNGAQALFLVTRYSYMFHAVMNCAAGFAYNLSDTLCRVLSYHAGASSVVPQIGLYGILTLRTYAIYQRNPFILVILGLPCVANVAVVIYNTVTLNPEVDDGVFGRTCDINPRSFQVYVRLQLASVILSLIIDALVFTLTFAKTIRHTIEMRKSGLGNGLGYFILRDGAMYFLAKLLIGVVATTVFIVPVSGPVGNWVLVINEISNPLTIILINRLVLNLRQVSHIQQGNAPTLGAIGTIQEPEFATNSILGNLGAPLRLGPEDDYYENEIEEIGVDDEAGVVEEGEIVSHTEIIEELRGPSDV